MNVTTKGRYALRVMMDLADYSGSGCLSLKTIADNNGISMKYLESIVSELKKSGIITSTRGKDGGYTLNRLPGEYTVGEILRCVEENLAPVSCISSGSVNCEQAAFCRTAPMWKELDDITNSYLNSVSLEDLITGNKWKG